MSASANLFQIVLNNQAAFSERLALDSLNDDESDVLSTILSEVRRFCPKHVDGSKIDENGKLGQELLTEIANRGWFGLTVPERFGGAGLSVKAATRVIVELAFYNGSLGTCVGLHSGLALYGLIHLASESLQEKYLPQIATGEKIAAFAATEPNAGSDIAAIRTALTELNGKFYLNGSKCYVTNGGICGVITVIASSPGMGGAKAGHTMVLVDPSWPGVSRQKEEHKLGLKGSSTLSIDFENVEIPSDHIIGEFSKGLEYAHRALTWGRTFMAAGCIGAGHAAIAHAKVHTSERSQFGRLLCQFPLVQEQTAAMIADLYAAEAVMQLVCQIYDTKSGDIALDSTVAKIISSETCWTVIDRGVQLLGGAGFIEETGMPRRLRDLRVTRIFEGANDVLRLHLAMSVLGWQKTDLETLPKLASMVRPELIETAQEFDSLATELSSVLLATKKRLGFRLFERQGLQADMAEGIVAAYSMMAAILRANSSIGRLDESRRLREIAIVSYAGKRLTRDAKAAIEKVRMDRSAIDAPFVAAILSND